jgi:uncharacterized membrane protein
VSRLDTKTRHWLQRLRLYFLTGLVALAPIAITGYILWHLFFMVDNWVSGVFGTVSFLTIGGRPVPGLGFITVLFLIIVSGIIARNIVGSQFLRATEAQFTRIPMVRSIYGGAKQLAQAMFGGKRAIFQQAVLIPFPTRGLFAVAFYTADAPPEIADKTGDDMVSVFLPTTPNPTSGYLLMVRRADIVPLEMGIEAAIKLIISGGAVIPEDQAEQLRADADVKPAPATVADKTGQNAPITGVEEAAV